MKIETKFNVGDTVHFLRNDEIYKGFINQTIINVRSTDILEKYEVEFLNRYYERVRAEIEADSLFENAKGVVEKLMKDFEKSEKDSDLNDDNTSENR